jgi:cytochrome c
MKRTTWFGVATFCAVSVAFATRHGAAHAGDTEKGKALYESRCTSCHSLDHSRIGPAHRGVFDRRVAQAAGFDYSPALRRSHIVWDAKTLDRWLTNPERLIPGQKMGYSVSDPQDRADIIAFLESAEAR